MFIKYPRVNGSTSSVQTVSALSLPMNMRNMQVKGTGITRRPQDADPIGAAQEVTQKKMLWGEPTWFLLHTLAEKVNESVFMNIRKSFFQLIWRICGNLPCPDCANHATAHLQGINFDAITTKEQLKRMLWEFHNTVNRKKGYPIYPFEKLDVYGRANVNNIIQNFLHFFEKKTYSMRVGTNSFHRGMAIVNIRNWLATNMQYFSM